MIKQNRFTGLIFTIILTTCYAQKSVNQYDNNGERHGIWAKDYEGTRQKRYEGQFNHGKEIGTFNYYKLKNGKSVLSATKVFNEINDIADVVFYTSAKKIVSKGQMNQKKFIGKWTYYHKNADKVMIEEHYNSQGELDGSKTVYYENGNVAEEKLYKIGKLSGKAKWYTKAKQYIRTTEYLDDKRNGQTINYDGKGNKVSEGTYKDDKKIGIWKYYKEGSLIKEIDHTNQKVIFKKD